MISAAWDARDYGTGRTALVGLANALEDDAAAHLTDKVRAWLALASLYLHMGDGAGATRVLLKVLVAVEDVSASARAGVSVAISAPNPPSSVSVCRSQST